MVFNDLIEFCLTTVISLAIALVVLWVLHLIIYSISVFSKPKNKAMYVLVYSNDGLECTFFKDIESANAEMHARYYSVKSEVVTEFCEEISKIIPNEFAILSDNDDNIHVWEIFKIPEVVM